jgi:hypothetical protein
LELVLLERVLGVEVAAEGLLVTRVGVVLEAAAELWQRK